MKLKTKTKTKTKNISSSKKKTEIKKQKQLTVKQFNKLVFPFRHLEISKAELLEDFQRLKEFNPIVLNINPTKFRIKEFQNEYVVFLENYYKYKNYYLITDYFSHPCRVKCIFNLKEDKSILDLFNENKPKILETFKKYNKPITFHNINEYIWRHFRQCTNFNTTVVVSVLKFFKPEKMLDFSAGWGDRLVGAIACEVDYTGVDPSTCMNPIYHKIIKTLAPETKKTKTKSRFSIRNKKSSKSTKSSSRKYRIIQDGFENVNLSPKTYDLVFTSPPFFDMEIYENVETQSVEKFNSVIKWKSGFLYPAIKKSYKYLKVKGHLALYITDFKDSNYIYDMKSYIKKNIKGFKYMGDLHWWDQNNKKTIRKIFVWKKIY